MNRITLQFPSTFISVLTKNGQITFAFCKHKHGFSSIYISIPHTKHIGFSDCNIVIFFIIRTTTLKKHCCRQ